MNRQQFGKHLGSVSIHKIDSVNKTNSDVIIGGDLPFQSTLAAAVGKRCLMVLSSGTMGAHDSGTQTPSNSDISLHVDVTPIQPVVDTNYTTIEYRGTSPFDITSTTTTASSIPWPFRNKVVNMHVNAGEDASSVLEQRNPTILGEVTPSTSDDLTFRLLLYRRANRFLVQADPGIVYASFKIDFYEIREAS